MKSDCFFITQSTILQYYQNYNLKLKTKKLYY